MRIERITVGMLQEHSYLIIDETSNKAFIVDPGAQGDKILEKIQEEKLEIQMILLTHGHFDHIGAVDTLRKALGVKVAIHEQGKCYLENPDYNLSSLFGGEKCVLSADQYLVAGDVLQLEGNEQITLKVVHAPGHTLDGVGFYDAANGCIFVGDIIFKGSIGRTDHPGGDMQTILASIPREIFSLPEDTVIYPGHGEPTTVGLEKATNPFFNIFD